MSITLQGLLVVVIVGAAAAYVGYNAWQTLRGKRQGCHCGDDSCAKKRQG